MNIVFLCRSKPEWNNNRIPFNTKYNFRCVNIKHAYIVHIKRGNHSHHHLRNSETKNKIKRMKKQTNSKIASFADEKMNMIKGTSYTYITYMLAFDCSQFAIKECL